MNELTLDGKIYVSSKRAAEMTGYAKDYVGQLCREGRVEARLVGRNWYILKTAIEKHRFASEAVEKEVPEPVAKDFTADTWVQPTYKEEVADLPTIEKVEIEESIEEEPVAPEPTTVEAMQDAWRGWFSQIESREEEPQEAKIAPEPVEEPESEETSIPLRSIAETREQPEVLNLRRIREYKPTEVVEEEPLIVSESVVRTRSTGRGYYRTIQAVCIVVALLAVGVAYIGAGFAGQNIISHKPASSIAGVSLYNKAQ